jgi:hypothetical protein
MQKSPIEDRLQASINFDAINGDSMERAVVGMQIQEAVYEIRMLRAASRTVEALQAEHKAALAALAIKMDTHVAKKDKEIATLKEKLKVMEDALERISRYDSYHQEWPNDIFINAPPEELATFALNDTEYPPETYKQSLTGEKEDRKK